MRIDSTHQMKTWKWLCCKISGNPPYLDLNWDQLVEHVESGFLTHDSWIRWDGLYTNGLTLGEFLDNEYFYASNGFVLPVHSLRELQKLKDEGKISSQTRIWGKRLPPNGIICEDFFSIQLKFAPSVEDFAALREEHKWTILSGRNNCGKTTLLKLIHRHFGPQSIFLPCNRFYHFSDLPIGNISEDPSQRYEQYIQRLYSEKNNSENYNYNVQNDISSLQDTERQRLFKLCSEVFGEEFEVCPRDEKNRMRGFYVRVGNHELATTSSGTRLFLLILVALARRENSIVIIDEPELGLSPELQSKLAKILFNRETLDEYFSHIQHIYIATHSHLFINKKDPSLNFVLRREQTDVTIECMQSPAQFHELVFRMLGNDLSAFYLPTLIIFVEGISDWHFVRRVVELFFPQESIAVVDSRGSGNIPELLRSIGDAFGGIHRTPYRNRTIILVDSDGSSKIASLEKLGIPDSNIIKLEKNGIEYYYPVDALVRITGYSKESCCQLSVVGDDVLIDGVTYTKKNLAIRVASSLDVKSEFNAEFQLRFINRVSNLLRE